MPVGQPGAVMWSRERLMAWGGGHRWHGGRWEENIQGGGMRLVGSGASLEAKLMGLDDGLDKG